MWTCISGAGARNEKQHAALRADPLHEIGMSAYRHLITCASFMKQHKINSFDAFAMHL